LSVLSWSFSWWFVARFVDIHISFLSSPYPTSQPLSYLENPWFGSIMSTNSKSSEATTSATTNSTAAAAALTNTKQAISQIQSKLEPVLQRLRNDTFEDDLTTNQARATVALSIGMMQYMGARLRGLDQGRNADDPLRKELNKMKKVLAEIKQRRQNVAEQPAAVSDSKTSKADGGGIANSSEAVPSTASPDTKPESNETTANDKSSGSGKKRGREDASTTRATERVTPATSPIKKAKSTPKPATTSGKKKRRTRR
jgi:hypothetical protein